MSQRGHARDPVRLELVAASLNFPLERGKSNYVRSR